MVQLGGRMMIVVVAISLLTASRCPGQTTTSPLPVAGIDPLSALATVEESVDALSHWVGKDFSDAVILRFDAHDALRPLGEAQRPALQDLYRKRAVDALREAGRRGQAGLYHEGDFLRAATELGIAREVFWVIPFTHFLDTDAEDRLRAYLKDVGFAESDIRSFQLKDGCFKGSRGAVPLTICGQEMLPPIDVPVLLSLDADFIPYAATARGISFLSEVRALFAALREKRYAVRDAILSFSVAGGDLPADLRWIGEAARDSLRDPGLTLRAAPPLRWFTLQDAYNLKSRGNFIGMFDVLMPKLISHADDPAILLLTAEALIRQGDREKALLAAEESCRRDQGYCYGLQEIGLQLYEQGDISAGDVFFAAGGRLLPGMRYGHFERGVALQKAGLYVEAKKFFEELSARNGAFPHEFMVGNLDLALGDKSAALERFDRALAQLERAPYRPVGRQEIAEAIGSAARLYREQGLILKAERLESDPLLRYPGEGPPVK